MGPLVGWAAEEQASDAAANSFFGDGVSISGSTGLAGAPLAKVGSILPGAAYLFRGVNSSSGTVTQDVKLTASDGAASDSFGEAVSLSGNTGLVGARKATVGTQHAQGAAYVFRDLDTRATTATQDVKLVASDGADSDSFGNAVSLSGNISLVGAYTAAVGGHATQGAAYVYRGLSTATGTVYENVKLTGSDSAASGYFGAAVSLDGSTGIVGAYGATVGSNSFQGAAYLYRGLNIATGTISENVKLTASDGAASDYFGSAVSLSGSIGLAAAPEANVGVHAVQGAVYVFRNLNSATGTVTENVKLTASDGAAGDVMGGSVSLSGNTCLAGAQYAKVGSNASQGAVYIFRNLDSALGTMTENVKLTASDGAAKNYFGVSVSLDGDQFLIGAYGASGNTGRGYSGTISSVTTLDTGSTTGVISGISFVSQENWIIGATTSGNEVILFKGDTANVTAGAKGVFVGQSAGSNNNTLLAQGTVVASSVTVSVTGAAGNTLAIDNDGNKTGGTVSAPGGISVNAGGTLQLNGATAITDRLGSGTPVTLASGGKWLTAGLSEGSSVTGSAAGFGKLTLGGGATLDFAAGAKGSTLLAASGAVTGAGLISILNWSGTAGSDSGAAGNDRLLFVADPGFTTAQLAQFQFYNDSSQAFAIGAREFTYNGFTEIVPIPEPGAAWLLLGGAGAAFFSRRRRFSGRRALCS